MQFIDSILNYYNEQLTNFEKLEAAFSDDQKEKWAELEVQLNEVYDSGVVFRFCSCTIFFLPCSLPLVNQKFRWDC